MNQTPLIKFARQLLAALLCAIYGFLAGGSVGAVATCLAYGVGGLFTAPAGFAVGAFFGWKTPLRDAILLMSGWIAGVYLGGWLCQLFGVPDEKFGSFVILISKALVSAAGGIGLFLAARKWLTDELRFHVALSFSIFWTLCSLMYLYRWLYVWEP